MLKIARSVKHIFNVARSVHKAASTSINRGLKYCTQSKGYIEDASDEFVLNRALPESVGVKLGDNSQSNLIDSAAIRKLTYARFADEFNALKSQGYDFAVAKKAIESQSVKSLAERMKGLVVAGYMSNYGGESGLKEEVEEVMHKKALVIEEFMQRLAGELEEHSTELLV